MDISKAPSPALEAVAGAAGALLALLSTYPLMTVNTRQQTEGKKADGTHDAVPANKKSTVGELLELIEEGGMGALYRGVQPAMIGTVVSQAVYYYWYSFFRSQHIARRREEPG